MFTARAYTLGTSTAQQYSRPARVRLGWLFIAALAGTVLLFGDALAPWERLGAMWAALWIGFKLLTLLSIRPDRLRQASPAHVLSYVFLWHGTDPATFLDRSRPAVSPRILLLNGARNMLCGALLLWALSLTAGLLAPPLRQAWIGLIGLGLLLHLGFADWLTAFWQWRDAAVERLFRFPLGATSVTEFWGGRWNLAFTQLTRRAIFRPLVRRFGSGWGTLAGFLFSGALHELVVSFPAGAGYGLPTLYFTLQGAAVVSERRWLRRTPWLRSRIAAWLWTCGVVAGPLPIMFHPPFLREIVLPLLRWLGAVP